MFCPKCGSNQVARERRPNGNDVCGDCHHVWPSNDTVSPFEQLLKERDALREKLDVAMEALRNVKDLIDTDNMISVTDDGEKEYWINHSQVEDIVEEALIKIEGKK